MKKFTIGDIICIIFILYFILATFGKKDRNDDSDVYEDDSIVQY